MLIVTFSDTRTKCPDIFEMVRHNINFDQTSWSPSGEPLCIETGAIDTEYGTKGCKL